MMPDGATMEQLVDKNAFNTYIKENGKMIYHYAKNIQRRDIENGGLHIVIGSVKSASWGIATFCNASKQSRFHLEFLSMDESGDLIRPMSWRHTIHCGTADVKAGPELGEIRDLQSMTEEGSKLCNQSLSATTLNFRISGDDWKKIVEEESVKLQDKRGAQMNPSDSVPSPPDTPPSTRPDTNRLFQPSPNPGSSPSNKCMKYSPIDSSGYSEVEEPVMIEKPLFSSVSSLPSHLTAI